MAVDAYERCLKIDPDSRNAGQVALYSFCSVKWVSSESYVLVLLKSLLELSLASSIFQGLSCVMVTETAKFGVWSLLVFFMQFSLYLSNDFPHMSFLSISIISQPRAGDVFGVCPGVFFTIHKWILIGKRIQP